MSQVRARPLLIVSRGREPGPGLRNWKPEASLEIQFAKREYIPNVVYLIIVFILNIHTQMKNEEFG